MRGLLGPLFVFFVPAATLIWLPDANAAEPLATPSDSDPTHIYGGTAVPTCGWPTTVSMNGSCTGTLVHPQVVIYAAHCGASVPQVRFGESVDLGGGGLTVATERCATYPSGGPGNGRDMAYCVLAEPVHHIPIVPPLMGCEASILTPGRDVVVVGFGETETGGFGQKREAVLQFQSITGAEEAFLQGPAGVDTCSGDSGGPAYVQMATSEGGDGSWRVFGITSYGPGGCGQGGWYSVMHFGMDWFETETGFDLSPCHDADGTWAPGPRCDEVPLNPGDPGGTWLNGCNPGDLSGLQSVCGDPFDASSDIDAPLVSVVTPPDATRIDLPAGENQAPLTVEIAADDGTGYGIDSVQLVINDVPVAQGILEREPFRFPLTLPADTYKIGAIATDFSGNVGEAIPVNVGVGMDPELPAGDETGAGESTAGDTSAGDDTSGGDQDDGGGDKGCGCRSPGAPVWWALLPLLAWRRRD